MITRYFDVFVFFSGQTNDIFMISLSTTNLNRSVDCRSVTQEQGQFFCQFCIEINDLFTCYDFENSTSNSAANAALTGLGEGTYLYRVTAFLNDVPEASIFDFFSTGEYYMLLSWLALMLSSSLLFCSY